MSWWHGEEDCFGDNFVLEEPRHVTTYMFTILLLWVDSGHTYAKKITCTSSTLTWKSWLYSIQFPLRRGAQPGIAFDRQDVFQRTPLSLALMNGHSATVGLLLGAKAPKHPKYVTGGRGQRRTVGPCTPILGPTTSGAWNADSMIATAKKSVDCAEVPKADPEML